MPDVPPGRQHVVIAAPGLMPLRVELNVSPSRRAPLDVLLDPEVHYTEVVSVSPDARDQFESYQPTSVLAGQELAKRARGDARRHAAAAAGVAERSFGPGPVASRDSRPGRRPCADPRGRPARRRSVEPVGRSRRDGQSGERRRASKWCAARRRCCTARTPSAASSTSSTRPSRRSRSQGAHGALVARSRHRGEGGRRRDGLSTAGNGRWAMHAGGSGRRNGDVETPEGTIENTQSRGGFGNVGVVVDAGRAASSARATATTTRGTAFRSSRKGWSS